MFCISSLCKKVISQFKRKRSSIPIKFTLFLTLLIAQQAYAVTVTSAKFTPSSVNSGGTSVLSWTSNGVYCDVDGQQYNGPNGSRTYTNLTATKNVTVVCSAPMAGSGSRGASVTVNTPPPSTPSSMSPSSTSVIASYSTAHCGGGGVGGCIPKYIGSVSLSWGASSGTVTRYEAQRRKGSGGWTALYNGTGRSAGSYSMEPDSWSFRVRACNSASCSSYRYSSSVTVKYPIPDTPTSMSITPSSTTSNSVTASWSVSNNVTRYEAQRRLGSGSWSNFYSGTARNSASSSMSVGTWSFRVRACNATGCSGYRNGNSVTIKHPIPGVPTSMPVSPTSTTATSVSTSWGIASGHVTRYEAQRRLGSGAWNNYYSGAYRSATSSSMSVGTWSFRVRACNATGCSGYRNGNSVTIKHPIPGVPTSMPVSPTSTTATSVSTSWGLASGHVTRYEAQRRLGSGTWNNYYSGAYRSATSSSMSVGTWSFRVRACNTTGCSSYRNGNSVTIKHPIPGIPSSMPVSPTSTTATSVSTSWGLASGHVTRYEAQRRLGSGTWNNYYSGAYRSATSSSMSVGTWSFRVRACNATGCSGYRNGNSVSILVPIPSMPSSINYLTSINTTSVAISWNAASGTVTSYQLEEKINAGNWTNIYSGTALNKTKTGLTSSTRTYRVRACNSTGCSAWKTGGEATVAISAGAGGLSISESNSIDGTYDISYSVNAVFGSPKLYERVNSGAWQSTVLGSGSGTRSYTKTVNGTYSYYITEMDCRQAQSTGSCAVLATIPTVSVEVLLLPAAPTSFSPSTTSTTSSTVSLNWASSTGTSTYHVERRLGSNTWTQIYEGSSTSTSSSGMGNGSWTFRVKACNQSGCSAWKNSAAVTVTLAPSIPSSITVPTSSTTKSNTINWGAATGNVTAYKLERKSSNGSWSEIYSGSARSFSDSVATWGSYTYQVKACNGSVCSGYKTSSAISIAPSLPGNPSALNHPATSTTGSYSLSWSAASGVVDRYEIQEKKNSGSWSTFSSCTGLALSCERQNLNNGYYEYQVRACNYSGCSAYAGSSISTDVDSYMLVVLPIVSESGSFTLSWAGGASANGKTRIYENGSSTAVLDVWGSGGGSLSLERPNGVYTYQLEEVVCQVPLNPGICNLVDKSKTVQVTVNVAVPVAPISLVAPSAESTTGNILLEWDSVAHASSYEIQYANTTGSNTWEDADCSFGVNSCSLNISASGVYSFRVRACSISGCSAYRESENTTPVNIYALRVTPANSKDGKLTLVWQDQLSDPDKYAIEEKFNTGEWTEIGRQVGGAAGHLEIVRDSGNYVYRVIALSCMPPEYGQACAYTKYSNEVSVTVDNASDESISITAPSNSSTIYTHYDNPANIALRNIEQGDPISNLSLYINDEFYQTIELVGSQNPFTLRVPDIGSYVLRAIGTKTSGLQILSADVTVSAERAPDMLPVVLSPNEGGYVFQNEQTLITANVENLSDTNPVTSMSAWVDGVNIGIMSRVGNTWEIEWTPSVIKYSTVHVLGNFASGQVTSASVNVNVIAGTNTDPQGGITDISNSGTISAWAFDRDEETESVNIEFYINELGGTAETRFPLGQVTADLQSDAVNAEHSIEGKHGASHIIPESFWDGETRVLEMFVIDGQSQQPKFVDSKNFTLRYSEIIGESKTPASMPSVSQSLIDASDRVGSIAGAFRVDESGSATYSISVAVPQGSGGTAPQVDLSYNSSAGSSIVGKGWNLGAYSSITRCRQSKAVDGQIKPLAFDSNSRFCLNGQRLLLTSGDAYGAVGAEYKTEIDTFVTVVSHGGTAGAPNYFEVKNRDGGVSYFGYSADSKYTSAIGEHVLTWSQSQYQDNVGNIINYVYKNDGGQRINKIQYAYGVTATNHEYVSASSHNAEIKFEYETRLDEKVMYIDGYKFVQDKRLSKIIVYNQGVNLREYILDYLDLKPSDFTYVSKLANIKECVGSVCLPATKFSWSENEYGYDGSFYKRFNISDDSHINGQVILDIDGNGQMDVALLEFEDRTRYQSNQKADQHLYYFMANEDGSDLERKSFSGGGETISYSVDVDQIGHAVNYERYSIQALDYNADGRQDLAFYSEGFGYWKIHLSVPYGSSWRLSATAINTPVTYERASFQDANGDGLIDAIGGNTVWYMERDLQSTNPALPFKFAAGTSFTLNGVETPSLVGVPNDFGWTTDPVSYESGIIHGDTGDFNGDGIADKVVYSYHYGYSETGMPQKSRIYLYALVTNGNTYEVFKQFEEPDGSGMNMFPGTFNTTNYRLSPAVGDINGDGLSDIVFRYQSNVMNPASDMEIYYALSTGTGFSDPVQIDRGDAPIGVRITDFNRDGMGDLWWYNSSGGSSDNQGESETMYLSTWNGDSFGAPVPVGSKRIKSNFGDVNGDGSLDLISIYNAYNSTDVNLSVRFGKGNAEGEASQSITRIENGSGNITNITYGTLSKSGHYEKRRINDATTNFYDCNPLTSNFECSELNLAYNKETTAEFYNELISEDWGLPSNLQYINKSSPTFDLDGPLFVVTQVKSSAPSVDNDKGYFEHDENAEVGISYYYGGAVIQSGSRGYLGFNKIKLVNDQTGVETMTTYRQDFPFTGMPTSTQVITKEGHLLEYSETEYELIGWNEAWRTTALSKDIGPLKPVLSRSIHTTYELVDNGASQGAEQQKITKLNEYNAFANLVSINETTEGGSGSTEALVTKVVENTYGTNNSSDSFFNRLGLITHNKTTVTLGTANNSSDRETSYSYFESGSLAGIVKTKTLEPNDAANAFTTRFEYDQFGNRIKAIQSPGLSAETGRTTEDKYDSLGRYNNYSINALGQVLSKVISRNTAGQPEAIESANGVRTYYAYTAFGKKYMEYSDAGSHTITLASQYSNICPANARSVVNVTAAGGSEAKECYDRLGRSVRKANMGFDGSWVYTDVQYDKQGKVRRQTMPYFASNDPVWAESEYDILGRLTKIKAADGSVSTRRYNGYTSISVNNKGQEKWETKNALGKLVEVIDDKQGKAAKITYEYNAEGKMRFVRRHGEGKIIETEIRYDAIGRKNWMNDPDKGIWEYGYTGYSELQWQKDAKGQTQHMTYDALGRIKTRIDKRADSSIEGSSTWTYDSAANGIGKIASVQDSVSGYSKVHTYDTLGRNDAVTTSLGLDGSYAQRVTYDQYSRIFQTFDAAGDGSWKNNAVENKYNDYGHLYAVVDAERLLGEPVRHYYEIKTVDALGNVTESLQGNGVTTSKVHNLLTGKIENITAVNGLNSNIQNLNYQWDSIGNLEYREELSGTKNLKENFTYDSLNRLDTYTVSGQLAQSMQYDSFGNITNKTGVGSYSYGAECSNGGFGPQAVCQTGDGIQYSYDLNGNLSSDTLVGEHGGRTISYSTFDKPIRIQKGNQTIDFAYGPDRSRYKRIDTKNNEVVKTLYLGNVEKVISSSKTEFKRYLPGGALVTESYSSDPTQLPPNENRDDYLQSVVIRYMHFDHLGSLDVITDWAGTIIEEHSFDVWGKRRNQTNWDAMTLADWKQYLDLQSISVNAITTTGYTGHEMLDDVGIIHMNGRIYDARLARFLQADPFVQSPRDSQMYNRYSYVRNNPLNATDPSGYFKFDAFMYYTMYYTGIYAIHKQLAKSPKLVQIIDQVLGAVSRVVPWVAFIRIAFNMHHSFVVNKGKGFNKMMVMSGMQAIMTKAGGLVAQSGKGGASFALFSSMMSGVMAEVQGGNFTKTFMTSVAVTAASGGFSEWMNGGGSQPSQNADVVEGDGESLGNTRSLSSEGQNNAQAESVQQERAPGTIYLTGHRVGKIFPYHTALEFDDGSGVEWISAGSEGFSWEGFERLVGGIGNMINGERPTDAPGLNETMGVITPPKGVSAGEYFNILKSAARNYNNSVDYDMFPGISDSYNSNSFVSGLLNATGGTSSVNMSVFVGGEKPLPKEHFGY